MSNGDRRRLPSWSGSSRPSTHFIARVFKTWMLANRASMTSSSRSPERAHQLALVDEAQAHRRAESLRAPVSRKAWISSFVIELTEYPSRSSCRDPNERASRVVFMRRDFQSDQAGVEGAKLDHVGRQVLRRGVWWRQCGWSCLRHRPKRSPVSSIPARTTAPMRRIIIVPPALREWRSGDRHHSACFPHGPRALLASKPPAHDLLFSGTVPAL